MSLLKPQLPAGAGLATDAEIRALSSALSRFRNITVLSGAGISTESGLGDYRSPGKRKPARPPINHNEYITSAAVRRRYWARSFVGYPVLSTARPGLAHHALAALHTRGADVFRRHVTQNVDGLLQRAAVPEPRLVELHGSIHGLYCRSCAGKEARERFQDRLVMLNSEWAKELGTYDFRPDGDADLDGELVGRFQVPACTHCGEDELMPSLVFHGGHVPKSVSEEAASVVDASDAMLIVGSTVNPWSAFRLAKLAKANGAFVACVNFGPTRADGILDLKVEALMGNTLTRLADVHLEGGFQPPEHLRDTFGDRNDPTVRMLEL